MSTYLILSRGSGGWDELERGLRDEFINAQKFEVPIHELKVWRKGNLAWYAMDLDYIRYVAEGNQTVNEAT